MKKVLIVISAILLSAPASSQWISDWFLARNYYRLGDTTVSVMYGDTLVNTAFVRDYVQNNSPAVTADSFYIKGQNEWIKTNENDTIYKIDTAGYVLKSDSSNYSDTAGYAANAVSDSTFGTVTGNDTVKSALFYGDTLKIYDAFNGNNHKIYNVGDNGFTLANGYGTDSIMIGDDGSGIYLRSSYGITPTAPFFDYSNIGTNKRSGAVYSGTADPTNTTRINYDGNFHAKELVSDTARSSAIYVDKAYIDSMLFALISGDTLILNGDTITGTLDAKTAIEAIEFDSLVTNRGIIDTLYTTLPHVSVYRNSDLTITLSLNVWEKITGFTTKDNDMMVVQGDSIQIPWRGSFDITFTTSFSGNNGEIWELGVFKNGVLEEPSQLRYTSNADVGNMSCPVYVDSDGDDWFSFKIRNTSDGDDPTIRRFSVIIRTEHLEK